MGESMDRYGSYEKTYKSKEQPTYSMMVRCRNCGYFQHWNIPKGITVGEYLRNILCPRCGCKELYA